jgi:hypothetical protein
MSQVNDKIWLRKNEMLKLVIQIRWLKLVIGKVYKNK